VEHKVRKEYHSICPLVGIGTHPTPHSPAGEGLGESQFRRLEKSSALCLLCAMEGRFSSTGCSYNFEVGVGGLSHTARGAGWGKWAGRGRGRGGTGGRRRS
jgi:hypothetical protein